MYTLNINPHYVYKIKGQWSYIGKFKLIVIIQPRGTNYNSQSNIKRNLLF